MADYAGSSGPSVLARNNASTGILDGGVVSVDADTTKFDIAAGSGRVVDNTTNVASPAVSSVLWTAFDAVTPTFIASQEVSFIGIDSAGAIVQSATLFSRTQARSVIILAALFHPDNVNVAAVIPLVEPAFNVSTDASDLSKAFGLANVAGNVYSANGINLNIDKTSGDTYGSGVNWNTSQVSPNRLLNSALVALSFQPGFRDGSGGWDYTPAVSAVDPDSFDDGSGILAVVGNNRWTIQRIRFFPTSNSTVIDYGQATYNTKSDAIESLTVANVEEDPNLEPISELRAFLIVLKGATDLSDPLQAEFRIVSGLGSGGSGGGGVNIFAVYFSAAGMITANEIAQPSTNGTPGFSSNLGYAVNVPVTLKRVTITFGDSSASGAGNFEVQIRKMVGDQAAEFTAGNQGTLVHQEDIVAGGVLASRFYRSQWSTELNVSLDPGDIVFCKMGAVNTWSVQDVTVQVTVEF